MNLRPPPYDLDTATTDLARVDARLAALIDEVGPCGLRLRAGEDLFDALLHAVVHQQLSGQVAARIHERVVATCDAPSGRRARALLRRDDASLLGAGLSRAKLATLRAVAERVEDGRLPDRRRLRGLDDAGVVALLVEVPGIGTWTAQMLLMHWLGRPDVLPDGDLGVRKGLGRLLGYHEVPSPATVREHGERWQPWRSVACWYLWRAAGDRRPAARPAAPPARRARRGEVRS